VNSQNEISDYQSVSSQNSPNFNESKDPQNAKTVTVGSISTRQQVKQMQKDAFQLGSTLQEMLDRFSGLENKLKDLDKEQQKQKTINEHLLH